MPFYEYECRSCGHQLEAMQKVSDAPLKKCPDCGKSQLQRLMSAPVFRLKGGGWYETDFKGDQDNKRNLADRPEADAPKEEGKEAPKDGAKEGAAADAPAGKEAAPKDKAADKPADKAPVEATKKAANAGAGKSSTRGRIAAPSKSPAKRPAKKPLRKPAAKTKRRR
jgi:putative FmdB family regulatory protein